MRMGEDARTGSIIDLIVGLFLTSWSVQAQGNSTFPALVMLGDSTLDVGTNNYLVTLVKSNFRPYGRDLKSKQGTGRFSNGLLVPDFIAQAFGLPFPLSYLDPEASGDTLLEGINFASAGSGWLESTAEILQVRSFKQQVQDLRDYNSKLAVLVGPARAAYIMSEALYIISTGSNDYVNNYFLNPVARDQYTLSQWQDQITATASQLLQDVYNAGARKILLASLPALGCLPATRSLYGQGKDECVSSLNQDASNLNSALLGLLPTLERVLPGSQFLFFDIYTPLVQAFQDPAAYGLEVTLRACCGTGVIEVAILCNADSPGTCSDASKYLFFDSFHPSQTIYGQVAQTAIGQIKAKFQ